jgi:hypothetical protein
VGDGVVTSEGVTSVPPEAVASAPPAAELCSAGCPAVGVEQQARASNVAVATPNLEILTRL